MKDVVVRSVENDEELRQANELMARSHEGSAADAYAWLTSFGAGYPGYRREHTRVALYGSQVVAALRLTTDTIRIGEARLKMGGLGWVATDGAWGRRGIISRVMTDTQRYLQEQRYHVSMIFGLSEYYRRWGFAPALCDYATTVAIAEAEVDADAPDRAYKVRAAKPGDIQAMQKMHALNDAETACSLIRTQAHLGNKWRQWETVRVLTDGRGKVAAYFRGARAGSVYTVDEAGVADRDACIGVVDAATRLAREACANRLRLGVPPNHPLIEPLHQRHAGQEMETLKESNGMMAFANLGEALESMVPEWESRLVQLSPVPPHAELTLLVGRTAWRVRAHHGAVDVGPGSGGNKIGFSAQELIQLTAGYRELDEVLATKRRIVNAEGLALLRAMFPLRAPHVWVLDRF